MSENSSFIVGVLVGIVLSIATIISFNQYFSLKGESNGSKGKPAKENTARTAEKNKTEKDIEVLREPEFPSDWYTSTQNFNLETRAIFSKSWILLTHSSRFSKPGDYHSFTICGFAIFLILGKDHKVRAFHNVCRHRAYTVTRKESGSSTVLGCRYHGWSYDVQGRLVKAPMFDDVPGFRKEENGLVEIPLMVGEGSGSVWINLDVTRMNESKIGDIEEQEKCLRDICMKGGSMKCRWLDGRTVEAGFNWKSAVDTEAFNIGDPHLPTPSLLKSWWGDRPEQASTLHLFPCSTVYKIPNTDLWYTVVLMPSSPTKTQIRWDLYSNSNKANKAVEEAIVSQIEGMISTQAQAFESPPDVVNEGQKENQHEILVQLKAHLRVERALGKEITPTMNKAKTSDKFLQAELLCKEIDCFSDSTRGANANRKDVLAW